MPLSIFTPVELKLIYIPTNLKNSEIFICLASHILAKVLTGIL